MKRRISNIDRVAKRAAFVVIALSFGLGLLQIRSVSAQTSAIRFGQRVPPEVDRIYEKGLRWLADHQHESGTWGESRVVASAVTGNCGIDGLCLMAFLAGGDDPNYGSYARQVHLATRALIVAQDPKTGYLPNSMYHHGFGMLALAEAYGVVHDKRVWQDMPDHERRRSVGEALELAVRCAVTAQKNNQWNAWRYTPHSTSADTSVAGAVLMGLLAARNAGIEVPDESVEGALDYFDKMTSEEGSVAYTGSFGGFGSTNLTAIATLVNAIGHRQDNPKYAATLAQTSRGGAGGLFSSNPYPFYNRYYTAQALFQGDFESWQRWNQTTIRRLKKLQAEDGSFPSSPHGTPYSTSMSLLALALNYRFLPIYER